MNAVCAGDRYTEYLLDKQFQTKRPVLPAIVSTGVNVVFTIAIKAPITAKTTAPQTHATVVTHRPK